MVEHDLAVVTEVERRVDGPLGTTRPSSLQQKECSGRLQVVLAIVAKERCMQRRRQAAPSPGVLRGSQGSMPQRANRRPPGPLARVLPPPLAAQRLAAHSDSGATSGHVESRALSIQTPDLHRRRTFEVVVRWCEPVLKVLPGCCAVGVYQLVFTILQSVLPRSRLHHVSSWCLNAF